MSFLRNLFCPKTIEHIFVSQNEFETNPMFYMEHIGFVRKFEYFRAIDIIDNGGVIVHKTQTHQYNMDAQTYVEMLDKYLGRPFVFTILPNGEQFQLLFVRGIKNNLDSNYTLLSDIISNELPH